jgi:hypothetical protein
MNIEHKNAVGTFPNFQAIESALSQLKATGFHMNNVSVVAQHLNSASDTLARFSYRKATPTTDATIQSKEEFTWGNTVERIEHGAVDAGDGFDLEPLERAFHSLLDVFRSAIESGRTFHPTRIGIRTKIESEFGGDRHLPTEGSDGFADQLFVRERTVDLGGIKEGYTAIDGSFEKSGHLLCVFGWARGKAHSHAAQPDR